MPKTNKANILKVNGFSKGLNVQQVLSYLTLIIQILLFSFFIVPNFVAAIKIPFSILYYTSTAIVIIAGYIATVIDPTDETVFLERRCRLEGKHFDESIYPYQCNFCETSVNEDSKHCRTCDRCVNDFDHHCNWINNCISKKNYRAFFVAIISLAASTSLFFTMGVLFLIDYYTDSLDIMNNVTIVKGSSDERWKPIVIAIFSGVAAIFCLLVLKLIIFHIYLMRNKISTYEYIIRQREQKNKKQNTKRLQAREKKVTPVSNQKTKIANNAKELDLEKRETFEAKDQKEADDSEDESEEDEESFRPQTSERPVAVQTHISLQSALSSKRGSRAFLFGREHAQKEVHGNDTERLEKLIRANSCTDIDIEQNISGFASPDAKLKRKRNSEISPEALNSIKRAQNNRNLKGKNTQGIPIIYNFDAELHLKNHQDTSTEGHSPISSRALSATWSGQPKFKRNFSSAKERSEYGNFIKMGSNLTLSPIEREFDTNRHKTKSIVEIEKLELNTKKTSSVSQAPISIPSVQNL